MMTIQEAIGLAEHQFAARHLPSPRFDAELLLAHVLQVERTWLHAHGESKLVSWQVSKLASFVERRLEREPVAYITGKKEFYGREFLVTPDVLVPRPETEDLIELVNEQVGKLGSAQKGSTFLDVGCGSGCIGISVKLENPELEVTLSDISLKALAIARKNSQKLGADVSFAESDLLSTFVFPKTQNPKPKTYFNLIVANLPYVDRSWETSPETAHEPSLALFASDGGLELIYRLITQSEICLKPGGALVLEADPTQHENIATYAQKYGFKLLKIHGYGLSFVRPA